MLGLSPRNQDCLAIDVPREIDPSPVWGAAWEEIDHARRIRKLELDDSMIKWAGFARSTWFVYKAKASIPLIVLWRLTKALGLRLHLEIGPARGYVKPRSAPQGAEMPQDTEEARQAADAINTITDPGFRAKLANKVLSEALKYKHRPPEGPQQPAEQAD